MYKEFHNMHKNNILLNLVHKSYLAVMVTCSSQFRQACFFMPRPGFRFVRP